MAFTNKKTFKINKKKQSYFKLKKPYLNVNIIRMDLITLVLNADKNLFDKNWPQSRPDVMFLLNFF
mgnify:CR=1 FL=1